MIDLQVYYPVRHHLIQHIVTSIQRLGFTATSAIEQKRLAVDLCEIVIKWEMQRVRDEEPQQPPVGREGGLRIESTHSNSIPDLIIQAQPGPIVVGIKRPSSDALSASSGQPEPKRKAGGLQKAPEAAAASAPDVNRPLDKVHCDAIVNYLLR